MFDDLIKPAAFVSLGLGVAGVVGRVDNAGAALPNPAILDVKVSPVAGTAIIQPHAGFTPPPPYAPIDPDATVRVSIRSPDADR